jgi:hypothetical protein
MPNLPDVLPAAITANPKEPPAYESTALSAEGEQVGLLQRSDSPRPLFGKLLCNRHRGQVASGGEWQNHDAVR